jgi:hypothetical protein
MSGYSAEGHGIPPGERRSPFRITPIKLVAGDTKGIRIDVPEADLIIWSVKQGTLEIVFSEASEMPSCPHLHNLGPGNPGQLLIPCQGYVVTAFNSDTDNPLIATIILGRRGY